MSDNGAITWVTETRRLGDLIPWEDNPRQLTKDQAKRLERSLKKFGYSQLVEIEPDDTFLDGHQRDDLMKIMDEFGSDAQIECRVSNRKFTLEERKEYIGLKHEGATGEWNWDQMHNLYDVDELIDYGFDVDQLEAFGFMAEEEQLDDPGAQIDRAEELREKWGVETGQLWRLGEHRLICGDCTDAEVVDRVMDIQPEMMVTDPPYGVEYDADWRDEFNTWGDAATKNDVENDDRADWSEAWRLFPGDVAYVWHGARFANTVQASLESCGFILRNQIIWSKPYFAMGRGDYHWQHEPCFYVVKKGKPSKRTDDRTQTTIWAIDSLHAIGRKEERLPHATQKPIECMERPIRNHNLDVVYDPFLGSGTTLIACERLGRKCRAVEISPAYVGVTLQRFYDMTGGEPILLGDGV